MISALEITVYGLPAPQGSKRFVGVKAGRGIGRGWEIYTLSTPSEGVRYVGVTVQRQKRLQAHINRAMKGGKTHKDAWIRSLINAGGPAPECAVIEAGVGDGWQEAEQKWIAHFLNAGVKLTNLTVGGEGCRGFTHSPESKAAQSARRKGATLSLEHKKAISSALKGRQKSPETRAAMAGRKASAETLTRMSAAQTGRVVSPQTLQKMSASRKGVPISEKARASRPKKLTGAHRLSIGTANRAAWAEGRRRK